MTISFNPTSLSWSDVDNLSTSVRNLSSASNEHNIQLTAQEDGDTVVLYARDTTKTGSLYPSQQGSVSKESPERAFKATQAAFENLYEKAGLDTTQLKTFFSNITEQPNRETSALKEGEILRLCTMAKAAKAAHLSQSTAQMHTERAQTLSSQSPLSLSSASKALQKEYQSHDATNTYIKDSYASKNTLVRLSLSTFSDLKNMAKSLYAYLTTSNIDIVQQQQNIKNDLSASGRKIDYSTVKAGFDKLQQLKAPHTQIKPDVLVLDTLQSDQALQKPKDNYLTKIQPQIDRLPVGTQHTYSFEHEGKPIEIKIKKTSETDFEIVQGGSCEKLRKDIKALATGDTAVFPFNHEGHWMLVTIKKIDENDFQLSGLSTSKHMPKWSLGLIETQKYEKALKDAMSIVKEQAPIGSHFKKDNIICGQVQNATGSSCGAYIYDIAERMTRNGGNEISAFNELANEVKDLNTSARRHYEINTLRDNLVQQQNFDMLA